MKRMSTVIALVAVACYFKSNAQTSVPFYGFELSNYEVGDTLEYWVRGHFQQIFDNTPFEYIQLMTVLGKETLSSDSIKFTVRIVKQSDTVSVETTQVIINNDTVQNNNNNLIGAYLSHYSSAPIDVYDTVSGLKHIYYQLVIQWITTSNTS